MILTGETLLEMFRAGELGIDPEPTPEQFQPATLDIRIGRALENPATEQAWTFDDAVVIHPWTFYRGTTLDYLRLPNDVIAQLSGRSTVGRMGVVIHLTAGVIDPGFEGELTLEIVNYSSETVELPVGSRVGQLLFLRLDRETDGYNGQYQGQIGPTPPARQD